MRHKDPVLKDRMVEFVNSFYDTHYRAPCLAEIGKEFELPKQTVWRYFQELHEENRVEYDTGNIVTEHIRSLLVPQVEYLPKSGCIPCGIPQTETEQTDEFVAIPKSMLGHGSYYVLVAAGDSMCDAGIDEGDWIIVRQTVNAEYGQIVVALDEHSRSTLKRYLYDSDLNRPYLHPENAAYDDLYPDEIVIQGVAEKVIKDVS